MAAALRLNAGSFLVADGEVVVTGMAGARRNPQDSNALAAALIHRLQTYYLPPVWGFGAMRWLGRHAFI